MKAVFALFTGLMIFSATPANASGDASSSCDQTELQFFGKVTNVRYYFSLVGTTCTFQIELLNTPLAPRPHALCPLSESDVPSLFIFENNCRYNNGDAISGILVRKKGRGHQAWIE